MCLNQLYWPTQLGLTLCQHPFLRATGRVAVSAWRYQIRRPLGATRLAAGTVASVAILLTSQRLATAHFMQFGPLDRPAVLGRWACIRTTRLFINEAVDAVATIRAACTQSTSTTYFAERLCQPSHAAARKHGRRHTKRF